MYLNIKNLCVFNNFIFKNLVHLMTQAYEKESFFTFSLFKIFIHELSLIFFTDCKELMRFINDLLVCFFFPLFQVSSFRRCLLHQFLSLLPRRLASLYVCLHVCLSLSVCLLVCLCLPVDLSLSLYLSLSSYFSHFRYIFFSFCLYLFLSIIQYFYFTHCDFFFLTFLV